MNDDHAPSSAYLIWITQASTIQTGYDPQGAFGSLRCNFQEFLSLRTPIIKSTIVLYQ